MITAILGMLSPKVSNTAGPGPGNLRLALRTGDRCGSVAWDQSGNEAKARGKVQRMDSFTGPVGHDEE